MKEIPLTKNKITQVDNEDYEKLILSKWHYHTGYAAKTGRNLGIQKGNIVFISSEILQTDKLVDHKDHNKLNNQKYNLRICTYIQNLRNQKKQKGKVSSKYKGICFHRWRKKWQASIEFQDCLSQRNSVYLGLFLSEKKAAEAYDKAARKYFGEFAALNFPGKGEQSCLDLK